MTEDSAFYDRALYRLDRIAWGLGGMAVLVLLVLQGWRGGLGCAVAAAGSIWNLRRIKGIAARAGGGGSSSAVLLGLRYVLLGGIAFVIIKYFGVSLLAVFAGLLISVAAVLIEIVYELIFTR